MSVEEALGFFEHQPTIARVVQTLFDVGLGYVRLGQPDRVGGAELLLLRYRPERQVRVLFRQPRLDGRRQMPRDPDDFIDADLLQLTEHVVEHGAIRDPQEGFGARVRVRAEPGSFSRQGEYGLHATFSEVLIRGWNARNVKRLPRTGQHLAPPRSAAAAPPARCSTSASTRSRARARTARCRITA